MGETRTGLVVALACLLVVVPMAGCLGSSSQSQSGGPADDSGTTTDGDTNTSSEGSSSPDQGSSDDSSQDGNASDDGQTTQPVTEKTTYQNSTHVNASVANPGMGNTPEIIIPPGPDPMWLVPERPENLTGVLIEFTWTTPTKGSGFGNLQADIDDGSDEEGWINESVATDGSLRVHVQPDEWVGGHLWTWVHPQRGGGVWVDADVTAYTTVFTGGPPDWSFSAT